MPRYRLTVEYDGSGFAGWQTQEGLPSVQGVLEKACAGFCDVKEQEILVVGAGRTDAGVHASGQVAHVDLPKEHAPYRVMRGINAHLPRPHAVAVLAAEPCGEDFHARFSATRRRYVYRILNRLAPTALNLNRVWQVSYPLDEKAMHNAAQLLLGVHDFSSFRDSCCQAKSPLKTLENITVERCGEEIRIAVSARSFLHHQVRIIVGTLVEVGKGRWDNTQIIQALEARDRTRAGPTAPAQGLCLTQVEY